MEDSVLKRFSERDVDLLLSALNILKIVTDTQNFRDWIESYKGLKITKEIFTGYRFFIDTTVRFLIYVISNETRIGLNEDFTFFRARFTGVNIMDLPNTCEKTIVLKNIWKLSRYARKAKNWNALCKSLHFLEPLHSLFCKLFEEYTYVDGRINKDDGLKYVTIFNTHKYFNDTRDELPLAYYIPVVLKATAKKVYLQKAFMGYVLTLEYLWYVLLGKEKFEDSVVSMLHLAKEKYEPLVLKDIEEEYQWDNGIKKEDRELLIENELGKFIKITGEDERYDKETEKIKKEHISLSDWLALDKFWNEIERTIIKPLESKLNFKASFDRLFVLKDSFNKKALFTKLLRKDKSLEPNYLTKKDLKSIEKKLDLLFWWYNLDVLEPRGGIFNGIPTFVSLLSGQVYIRKIIGMEEKVHIRRVKHPQNPGYNYSYAILIPSFGSTGISDYSGWLVFYDCATDYSGFGGSLHNEAELFIERFHKRGYLDVKEIIVEAEIFREYLKNHAISSVFDAIIRRGDFGEREITDIDTVKRNLDNFISETKGKLFEYLCCYLLSSNNFQSAIIKCDVSYKREQFDVIAIDNEELHLFECKINVHTDNIKKTIKQISRKTQFLKNNLDAFLTHINLHSTAKLQVVPHLMVYMKIPIKYKHEFEKNRIIVWDNIEDEIRTSRFLDKDAKRKLRHIFKFDIFTPRNRSISGDADTEII